MNAIGTIDPVVSDMGIANRYGGESVKWERRASMASCSKSNSDRQYSSLLFAPASLKIEDKWLTT
jgi:hypothetical protein